MVLKHLAFVPKPWAAKGFPSKLNIRRSSTLWVIGGIFLHCLFHSNGEPSLERKRKVELKKGWTQRKKGYFTTSIEF
ncbi:hypothetical protein CEXT_589811 [Caerostris extrusa]|uniref:Uncharacterized protein n=1 Tax=Caerostris extrusa TaxID=172846 RepID=A0AAV4P1A5_CAEEX|nr:hypothetical protein CEXT_589811 [Caerostris extrusa]